MLEVGAKAPNFTLPDQNGKLHSLEDYRGKKVILCRNDSCKKLSYVEYGSDKKTDGFY